MKIVTFLFMFVALQLFAQQSEFNYPLETGDMWEYLETDEPIPTCAACPGPNRYSTIKEVIGDTLMPNGLTYKIIKRARCSNSSDNTPTYEFQRMDSNKVFIYYYNKDWVLYNFNLQVNDTYPSHLDSCTWKLAQLLDFDFGKGFAFNLYKKNKEYSFLGTHIIIDSIGIYNSYIYNDTISFISNYFGGVFNNKVHNYPLAFDKNINWTEFYPLQIGNLWIYNVREGSFRSTKTVKVIGDTVMPDMNKYSIINERIFGGPHPNNSTEYRRIDSTGTIYSWNRFSSSPSMYFKLSACAGDTFHVSNHTVKVYGKSENIIYFEHETLEPMFETFVRGKGLSDGSSQNGYSYLRGFIINGVVNGDTILVGINDEILNMPDDFYLAQNYPNPFNPNTTINYNIKEEGLTSLRIYNSLGEEIKTLVNEVKSAGTYQATFTSDELSSGIYFYVLSSGENRISKKMILLK